MQISWLQKSQKRAHAIQAALFLESHNGEEATSSNVKSHGVRLPGSTSTFQGKQRPSAATVSSSDRIRLPTSGARSPGNSVEMGRSDLQGCLFVFTMDSEPSEGSRVVANKRLRVCRQRIMNRRLLFLIAGDISNI